MKHLGMILSLGLVSLLCQGCGSTPQMKNSTHNLKTKQNGGTPAPIIDPSSDAASTTQPPITTETASGDRPQGSTAKTSASEPVAVDSPAVVPTVLSGAYLTCQAFIQKNTQGNNEKNVGCIIKDKNNQQIADIKMLRVRWTLQDLAANVMVAEYNKEAAMTDETFVLQVYAPLTDMAVQAEFIDADNTAIAEMSFKLGNLAVTTSADVPTETKPSTSEDSGQGSSHAFFRLYLKAVCLDKVKNEMIWQVDNPNLSPVSVHFTSTNTTPNLVSVGDFMALSGSKNLFRTTYQKAGTAEISWHNLSNSITRTSAKANDKICS